MMTIKDLSISKELDSKAMTEVRGGGDVNITSTTFAQAAQTVTNNGLGAAVGVQETKAFSENNVLNFDDNSVKFSGYPYYWV
jgi:hypothetical protein